MDVDGDGLLDAAEVHAMASYVADAGTIVSDQLRMDLLYDLRNISLALQQQVGRAATLRLTRRCNFVLPLFARSHLS